MELLLAGAGSYPFMWRGFRTGCRRRGFWLTERPRIYCRTEYRITLKNLPDAQEDDLLGITMICLEFDGEVSYWGSGYSRHATRYPQLNRGEEYDPAIFPG